MSADTSFSPYKSGEAKEKVKLSEIDRSLRTPGMFFLVSAVIWLFVGTVFAIMASYKLHTPDFLANYESLTFGRVPELELQSCEQLHSHLRLVHGKLSRKYHTFPAQIQWFDD